MALARPRVRFATLGSGVQRRRRKAIVTRWSPLGFDGQFFLGFFAMIVSRGSPRVFLLG